MNLSYHEAANIFPLMETAAMKEFKADIEKNGLRESIELFDGKIIDGRNRYVACLELGIKCPTIEIKTDDPVAYVLSKNLYRRHLDTSQASMVAARAEKLKKNLMEDAKKKMLSGKSDPEAKCPQGRRAPQSRDQLGTLFGISGKSVERATTVIEQGIPDLQKAVDAGKLSVNKAAHIAKSSKELQKTILDDELNKDQKGGNSYRRKQKEKKGPPKRPDLPSPRKTSEKAAYISAWIKNGERRDKACASLSMGKDEYKRARMVVEFGNKDLIEAMDEELLSIRAAHGALKKPDSIPDIIEKARYEREKKKHKTYSFKGKPKPELLIDLLSMTYTYWSGAESNLPINSATIPSDPKRRADVARHCKNIRRIVNNLLNKIEKEIEKCSSKTAE